MGKLLQLRPPAPQAQQQQTLQQPASSSQHPQCCGCSMICSCQNLQTHNCCLPPIPQAGCRTIQGRRCQDLKTLQATKTQLCCHPASHLWPQQHHLLQVLQEAHVLHKPAGGAWR